MVVEWRAWRLGPLQGKRIPDVEMERGVPRPRLLRHESHLQPFAIDELRALDGCPFCLVHA